MNASLDTGLTHKQTAILLGVSALMVILAVMSRSVIPLGLVKFVILGAIAPIVALLVFSYPKHGLYFTVFYICAGLNFYTGNAMAAPLVILIATAALLRILRGEHAPVSDTFFSSSICLFTVLVIQSTVYAWYPGPALLAFSVYAKALVVVLLCIQLIRTPGDYEKLAMTILAGVVATVVLGMINAKMGWEKDATVLIGIIDFTRFAGTHVNPNNGALYMVAGVPLAVYGIRRVGRVSFRVLFGLVAVGLIVATIMTFSRQAIFPLSFVLLAVAFKEARNKWGYLTVIVVVLLTLLLVPPYYWFRLRSVSDLIQGMSEDWSFFLRVQAHKTAWHLFVDSPLTGVGLNNFAQRSASELIVRIPTHNTYLDMLVGLGIFGFLAYLTVMLSGIRGFVIAMRTRWSEDLAWMSHLSYYFLISFLSILFGAIFQSISFYYLVWIPVAGGVIARRLARGSGEPREIDKISET